MLRKFKISIDGKEYLVEMEEIGGVQQQTPVAPVAPTVVQTPEVAPTPEAVTTPVASAPAGEDALTAPMPGTILKVLVKPGDVVQENQPLLILEAMKMENEVVANKPGTIIGVHVNQGDVVNPGDALLTIG